MYLNHSLTFILASFSSTPLYFPKFMIKIDCIFLLVSLLVFAACTPAEARIKFCTLAVEMSCVLSRN